MKRFYFASLRFVLICIVMVLIPLFVIKVCNPPIGDMSAYELKRGLLEGKGSPSLVLLGGSNVLFGFDSGMLSDSLGIPVINAAITSPLGLKFMLDQVSRYLCIGDVLLLSPEYGHMFGDAAYGMGLESYYWYDPLVRGDFCIEQYVGMLSDWIGVPRSCVQNTFESPQFTYRRDLNAYGDHTGHWGAVGIPIVQASLEKYVSINLTFLDYYAVSVRALRSRGVVVVILPPSLACSSYEVLSDRISAVRVELSSRDIDFQLPPADFVYPDSLFFDTCYHLGYAGVLSRTSRVLSYLRPLVHP